MTLPASVAMWPERWRDDYQERSAILEYDANMRRVDAEREAMRQVREQAEERTLWA